MLFGPEDWVLTQMIKVISRLQRWSFCDMWKDTKAGQKVKQSCIPRIVNTLFSRGENTELIGYTVQRMRDDRLPNRPTGSETSWIFTDLKLTDGTDDYCLILVMGRITRRFATVVLFRDAEINYFCITRRRTQFNAWCRDWNINYADAVKDQLKQLFSIWECFI